MNEMKSSAPTHPSKVANLIDQNLDKMAVILEDVAGRIATVGANGDLPANFASTAIKQIESANDRMRSVDGERIIAQSKDAIERHPAATTIIAAAIGAAVAQIALFTVRRERQGQQPSNSNR